jgi:hypothetical protein
VELHHLLHNFRKDGDISTLDSSIPSQSPFVLVQNSNWQKRVKMATIAWWVEKPVDALFTDIHRTRPERCRLQPYTGRRNCEVGV